MGDNAKDAFPVVRAAAAELKAGRSITHDPGRRKLLGRSTSVAALGLAALEPGLARAAPLPVPESARTMGRGIPDNEHGMPSQYEAHVKRRRSDVLVNRQNLSDWSMTPLHQQLGTVTPTGLIYERHHNGVPE